MLGHHNLATEHLVIGLLVEENGIAGQALQSFGVSAAAARAETARILGVALPSA